MRIIYTRHSRNRMRLYQMSAADVAILLDEAPREPGLAGEWKAEMEIAGYNKAVVFREEDDEIVIITVWSDARKPRR